MIRAESFDVVLLDILMPGKDGYHVLEHIKCDVELREVPVIVISALDEMDSVVRCIEMGAEDYLLKPFNPVLLKARLHSSLEKKKLRDLERAYLQQEMMLRQNEKLATLGKISAGVAHDLNNPAAAAQRGAEQLRTALPRLQQAHLQLDKLELSDVLLDALLDLDQRARERASRPVELDALTYNDREYELETWLEDHEIENGWEVASELIHLGYDRNGLTALARKFTAAQLPSVVSWLGSTYMVYTILEEISQDAGRITKTVKAMKSYSYLDQAPIQSVDVHEGLEDTLVMLSSKLKTGVRVRREYSPDLPRFQAYGSELNQVWTNIIDNAAAVMEGRGELTLRTRQVDRWIVVEIEDDGPGIPETIQPKIFDPFFTTKPPGQGIRLGLNVSHNIVVQKHNGEIRVNSQPGRTCFEVRLPID